MADYENDYGEEPRTNDRDELPRKQGGSATPWVLLVLVLGIAGAGGYFWRGLYKAAVEQRATALKDSEEAVGKMKELEQARADLQERVKKLEEEKGSLAAEVQSKDEELAKLKATYDNLQEQLKSEIATGDIKVTQSGSRLQVDMVENILFASGEAEVTEKGGEVLKRLGGVLAKVDDKAIQVSGHTDDSPIANKELQARFPTNWELSAARAVNVVRFLHEKAKVPPKRLVAAGYGQYHPITTNVNHEGRARNRRIEIVLAPPLEAQQAPAETAVAAAAPAAPAKKGKTSSKKKTSRR
jgi:chemotaxis protein MotB